MTGNRQADGATPPPDLATALATMASHMVERQMELMQALMRCTDPATFTAATTEWTERSFTGFIADQARVMEAAAAQAERFTRTSLQ